MDCRTDKSYSLKKKLGFKLYDVINTKEQTIINSIKDMFEGENIQIGNTNRNINNEIEGQKALEKESNCILIRINPDEKDFNIFKEINKIHRHIKKFLIDKI